jgi:hypothetical protein
MTDAIAIVPKELTTHFLQIRVHFSADDGSLIDAVNQYIDRKPWLLKVAGDSEILRVTWTNAAVEPNGRKTCAKLYSTSSCYSDAYIRKATKVSLSQIHQQICKTLGLESTAWRIVYSLHRCIDVGCFGLSIPQK